MEAEHKCYASKAEIVNTTEYDVVIILHYCSIQYRILYYALFSTMIEFFVFKELIVQGSVMYF